MGMPQISFVKKHLSPIQVGFGTNLMKALLSNGIPVASSCHGDGICSKCLISFESGIENTSPSNEREQDLQKKMNIPSDRRVSCQTEVWGDITIDTGNPATNVIPAQSRGTVNIRFNDAHSGASLSGWLRAEAAAVEAETGVRFSMTLSVSGESFLTPPGPLSDLVARAVRAETGIAPALSTSGGTSDARFVKDHCPVVEFGLVGKTMHQVDERVEVAQIVALKAIYSRILRDYFA
jgi:acetylornithine deacetylase/succinyl-diaminopimelate desuccinylase-like protein